LAAIGAAGVARYARTSALDAIGADWIRTARAKDSQSEWCCGDICWPTFARRS